MNIRKIKQIEKYCQQLETALHYRELEFKATFEQAAVGIAHVGIDGHFLRLNQKFCEITGYTRNQLLTLTFEELAHPDDQKTDLVFWQQLLAKEIPHYSLEKRYIRSDSTLIWVNLTVSLMRNVDGEVGYFIAVLEDISKRKNLEFELQRQQQLFKASFTYTPAGITVLDESPAFVQVNPALAQMNGRPVPDLGETIYKATAALYRPEQELKTLVENSPDVIARFDRESRYVYVNPAIERVTGKPAFTLIGKTLEQLGMPSDFLSCWNQAIQSCFDTAKEQSIEFELLSPSGELKVYQTLLAPELQQDGAVEFVLGFTRDMTCAKQSELETQQALAKEKELNRLKSSFISMASHQFRTPLTTIVVSAEILEGINSIALENRQSFVKIKESVQHLERLISDILLISSIEVGKVKFAASLLDVSQFIQEVLSELKVIYGEQRIEVPNTGEVNWLLVDKKLLGKILINLIDNAIKYSPKSPTVQLKFGGFEGKVVFQVQDRGIGIPPEDKPHIFECFHRGSNVGKISGMGLGLAIVKHCVDLHGGEIAVDSVLGLGTTFTVTLPQGS